MQLIDSRWCKTLRSSTRRIMNFRQVLTMYITNLEATTGLILESTVNRKIAPIEKRTGVKKSNLYHKARSLRQGREYSFVFDLDQVAQPGRNHYLVSHNFAMLWSLIC